MSKLNATQSQHLNNLITRLRNTPQKDMNVGLTRRGGMVDFIMSYRDAAGLRFSSVYGGEAVMFWFGNLVTSDTTNRIASYMNALFGDKFYTEILLAGDPTGNYTVSIADDILPHLLDYAKRFDNLAVIEGLKRELSQVRTLLSIARAPASAQVKNLIASSTVQRWETMERKLVADVAQASAF